MSKNLLEILEENDIKVIPRSERWVALCVFHAENTPSFTIYPDYTYYCFGCKAWGDAVKFLVDYKGMPEELAREYAGIEHVRRKPVKRVIKVQNVMQIYPYLYEIAEKYHRFLLGNPGAIHYLKSRGLTDETIRDYKIGFTDGGLIEPQTAFDYGLARDSSIISEDKDHNYWETLAQRITIPNVFQNALCDYIVGRTVTKSKVKYLGLKIPKPLYGLVDTAPTSPVLFLVEGQFDWLILRQWGYPAICSGGTNIPTYNLIPLKSRHIVIVPDNDDAGMKAAKSLHEKLPNSQILDYSRWGAKDIGELVLLSDGQSKFEYEVRNQGSWLPNLSQTTLERWFRLSSPITPLPLT